MRFTLTYNENVAMGLPLGALGRWPLIVLGMVMIGLIVGLAWRSGLRVKLERVAFGLILGGALGNWISRVRFEQGVGQVHCPLWGWQPRPPMAMLRRDYKGGRACADFRVCGVAKRASHRGMRSR